MVYSIYSTTKTLKGGEKIWRLGTLFPSVSSLDGSRDRRRGFHGGRLAVLKLRRPPKGRPRRPRRKKGRHNAFPKKKDNVFLGRGGLKNESKKYYKFAHWTGGS